MDHAIYLKIFNCFWLYTLVSIKIGFNSDAVANVEASHTMMNQVLYESFSVHLSVYGSTDGVLNGMDHEFAHILRQIVTKIQYWYNRNKDPIHAMPLTQS